MLFHSESYNDAFVVGSLVSNTANVYTGPSEAYREPGHLVVAVAVL